MAKRDFPEYGPMARRRGTHSTRRNMAAPLDDAYTGHTIPMQTVAQRVSTQRQPPPRRGGGWWWKAPLLIVALLAGASVGGLAWLDKQYERRIYPNITLQGVDLSQQTPDEALQSVQQRYGAFAAQPITLKYQDRTWQPTAAELGINLDFKQAVLAAYQAGRGNGLVDNLRDVAAIYQIGKDVPLHVMVDQQVMNRYLASIAQTIDQPAREAMLQIADARVSASDSSDGRMVLLDDTTSAIVAQLSTLEPQVVSLETVTLRPQLTTNGMDEARRTAQAMLETPLVLRFNDISFDLDQSTLADMIVITRVNGLDDVRLNAQIDQNKLNKWVTKLADKIGRASVEPRVSWNGGNLQIVRDGRIGYRLDVDRTVEMINGAVTTVTRELDLPVDEVQPRVTAANLQTLGITELVSSGRSDFTGSAAYRVTNIKAGVNLISGILIAPGDEFSFNENVGAIDEAHGFVEGYAIVGNRTQKEPGGGICQDSTTLFRAAFYAGLPFTDWTPHRFRISWYEKYDTIGMDSTIFTGGGPDLRFVNDTGNWLLIQGYVNDANATVTFALYGTKVPGRVVVKSDPVISNETPAPTEPLIIDDAETPYGEVKQTDVARGGLDIRITRTVYQDGAVLRESTFTTKFQPWPNIYVKNPQTPRPAGL